MPRKLPLSVTKKHLWPPRQPGSLVLRSGAVQVGTRVPIWDDIIPRVIGFVKILYGFLMSF
jgi:hypothetical protein